MPLIGAGKSLRFALLAEGQDPDDLIRASGPSAVAEVFKGARPFADMLFKGEGGPADSKRAVLLLSGGRASDVPGVKGVTWFNWFGAHVPGKEDQFFGNFATDPKTFFDVYDEVSLPADQKAHYQEDRRGAIVGVTLARLPLLRDLLGHLVFVGAERTIDMRDRDAPFVLAGRVERDPVIGVGQHFAEP